MPIPPCLFTENIINNQFTTDNNNNQPMLCATPATSCGLFLCAIVAVHGTIGSSLSLWYYRTTRTNEVLYVYGSSAQLDQTCPLEQCTFTMSTWTWVITMFAVLTSMYGLARLFLDARELFYNSRTQTVQKTFKTKQIQGPVTYTRDNSKKRYVPVADAVFGAWGEI